MTSMMDKLSIYVPQKYRAKQPIERLTRLAKKKDRSVNYLVVQAIIDFVEKEERRKENGE